MVLSFLQMVKLDEKVGEVLMNLCVFRRKFERLPIHLLRFFEAFRLGEHLRERINGGGEVWFHLEGGQ